MFTRDSCVVAAFSRIHLILQILFTTKAEQTNVSFESVLPFASRRCILYVWLPNVTKLPQYFSKDAVVRSLFVWHDASLSTPTRKMQLRYYIVQTFSYENVVSYLHSSKFKSRINVSLVGFLYSVWNRYYFPHSLGALHLNINGVYYCL